MYRILLVDDEQMELDGLAHIIESNFNELKVIGKALNGREAIEMALDLRPNIIFMDIKMPGIDGIDASKEILRILPNTRIVIVTAYDYFRYAKEALNIGVKDYLLKPTKRKDVIEVLSKMMHTLDLEKQKRFEELEIKEKLNTVMPILENQLISSLVLGEFDEKEIKTYMDVLGVNFVGSYCMVANLNIKDLPKEIEGAVNVSVYKQKVFDHVIQVSKNIANCIVGVLTGNLIPIFVLLEDKKEDYEIRVQSINIARKIVERVKNETEAKIFIGIGNPYYHVKNFHKSYHQALKASKIQSISNKANHYADLNPEYEEDMDGLLDKERTLMEQIGVRNIEKSKALVLEILNQFFSNYSNDMNRLKFMFFELLVLMRREISDSSNTKEMEKSLREENLIRLMQIKDLNMLKSWMENKAIDMVLSMQEVEEEKVEGIINKAKKYIEVHYQDNITLEEVAKDVCISPYYFSKLFKESEGKTFIDYLTDKRIDQAKKYLLDENMNIKEVGFKVGYQDPNYFSRVFKKVTGMTPSIFRNKTIE